jgi:dihydroorotase (multifunctional complex type)
LIVDLVLINAKAYLKHEIVNCSIAVEDGKILKIGRETQMPKADERISLANLLVLPGLIDAHVHLRDEGKAYKEDFYSGTAAAAAGGFTTVLDMPNNDPVTMSRETLRNRMHIAKRKVLVNVGFYSEFPSNLEQVEPIVAEGALAFKLFMAHQVGGLNVNDDDALHEGFARVGEAGVPVAVHAEDEATISEKEQALKAAKRDDPAAFLMAHPEEAEVKAIERVLKTTAETKARMHFCHVSTEAGLDRIAEAKKAGRTVTCEITPNHLLLSRLDFERGGALLAMMPPLRSITDVGALWQGINSGSVDVLGSDHAPHTVEEKSAGSIWDVKVGVPALETTLPLMLTMMRKNRLTIDTLVRLLAEKPAEIFGLKGRGRLEQRAKADLTAIDLKAKFKIDASRFHSKAKYSPYEGWEVQGKPVKTFVNGHLVMDNGEIVAKPGSGSIVWRGTK